MKYGKMKEKTRLLLKKHNKFSGKGIITDKYSGAIRLKDDPLQVQKELRDEWK
jgi:hypothetical protein